MPSKKNINMNLYRLTSTPNAKNINDLLISIDNKDLHERVVITNYGPFRVDNIDQAEDGNNYWIVNFSKFRDDGPGIAKFNTPSKGIPVDDDEKFTEEASVLFDCDHNKAIIEYSHRGPRAGNISDYLSIFAGVQNESYQLQLMINHDAMARLQKKKSYTSCHIKVSPFKLSQEAKKIKVGLIKSILDSQKYSQGVTLEMVISVAKNDPSLSLNQDDINALISLADEPDGVHQLILKGWDEKDGPLDTVNLIKEKIFIPFKNIQIDETRRVSYNTRKELLVSAYNTWQKNGVL